MDHVSNQIVAGNLIATTPASQRVVAPFIHDLSATRAVCVLGPDGHAEATTEADLKLGCRDVRLEAVRIGEEPRTSSGNTVEAEVCQAVALLR